MATAKRDQPAQQPAQSSSQEAGHETPPPTGIPANIPTIPAIGSLEPFGAKVRRWRQRIGMSQAELARRLAYSPAYLCDIERGYRHPGRDVRRRILRELLDVYQQQAADDQASQTLDEER